MRSILVLLFIPFYTFAQTDSLLFKEIYIVEGDTFITAEIQSVDILSFKTDNDKRYYDRLKRKTLKKQTSRFLVLLVLFAGTAKSIKSTNNIEVLVVLVLFSAFSGFSAFNGIPLKALVV